MDTKSVIARFEAERQALALMDHPNIAKVLDAGSTERPLTPAFSPSGGEGARRAGEGEAAPSVLSVGRPFFVMELVRRIKITDYCDQNNLTTEQRLELFIQLRASLSLCPGRSSFTLTPSEADVLREGAENGMGAHALPSSTPGGEECAAWPSPTKPTKPHEPVHALDFFRGSPRLCLTVEVCN
jgi:hypothetical protein